MSKALNLPKDTKLPDHIVIIPDGNRRWARARGLTAMDGHKAGLDTMIETLRAARKMGVHTATVWGLSTENWRERPEIEYKFLMRIISKTIDYYLKEAQKEGIRVIHLGRKDRLPKSLINKIANAEDKTRDNTRHVLNIALDYGGQQEIVRAVQGLIADGTKAKDVDVELLNKYMDTNDQPYPYPDMIIRTSGEQRTSGILLWQSHYAESYWEYDHFPDFGEEKLKCAILDYSRRRRRYGGNDAVKHLTFEPEVSARMELAWWRLRKVPEGTRLRVFAVDYLKEQYGLSKSLAKEAAVYMLEGVLEGDRHEWEKAIVPMKKFYKLLKKQIKLAFEPEIVASLRVAMWKEIEGKSDATSASTAEDVAKKYYAEMYRISDFQAQKAAHLRVLAEVEKNLAEENGGDYHWEKAEDYLEKFYAVLKDRVA